MPNPLLVALPNEEVKCPECGGELLLIRHIHKGLPLYYWICNNHRNSDTCEWLEDALLQGGE